MTETMLALVALMITLFFTMSQQQGIVQNEREIASIELEVMANAMGSEMMQRIATQEFDAATTGVDLRDVDLVDLTVESNFGDSLDCRSGACTDIDDYNDMQPFVDKFKVGSDTSGTQQSFIFAITADVKYVDDQGNESETPTWTKEVTLYVDQLVHGNESKYLLYPIEVKRQFSPQ